jgi:hypothetical protein
MQIRPLLAVVAALAVAPAFGQTIGTVTSVTGVATVTTSSGGTTLAPGAPVVHGSRIVTTSGSSATLSLNSGCTLVVPPSHAVTVLSSMTCQDLQAAVKPMGAVAAGPGTSVMGQSGFSTGGLDPAVAIWGAGVIGTVIYAATRDENGDNQPLSGR